MTRPYKISGFDIPTADLILPSKQKLEALITDNPNAQKIINAHQEIINLAQAQHENLKGTPPEKRTGFTHTPNANDFSHLQEAIDKYQKLTSNIEGIGPILSPGGNANNKLHNLVPLLGGKDMAAATIYGYTGNDDKADAITQDAKNSGIEIERKDFAYPNPNKMSVIIPCEGDKICLRRANDGDKYGEFFDHILTEVSTNEIGNICVIEYKATKAKPNIVSEFLDKIPLETIVTYTPSANGNLPEKEEQNQKKFIERANILSLNLEEAQEVFKKSYDGNPQNFSDFTNLLPQIRQYCNLGKNDVITITDGPEGCLVIGHNFVVHASAKEVDPQSIENTIGAGDAFAAAFLAEYAKARENGEEINEEFAKKACKAGNNLSAAVIQQQSAQIEQDTILETTQDQTPTRGFMQCLISCCPVSCLTR